MTELAYLDHAATSALRPRAVIDAVTAYLQSVGATPGRGGHRLAIEAGRIALNCRQSVASLLNIPGDAGRITFTANATFALNTALHGTVHAGERVVVTTFDHNAVLRPAAALAKHHGVDIVLIDVAADGGLDDAALTRALDGARLLTINAASNVLGTRLDVGALARAARDAGALTLVDVAQVAGHAPFDTAAAGVDMVAFTGHKGMLGPQGIGGLWVREGIDVEPLITGGTGGDSMQREMPATYPDHLEAGTINGPAIAGLAAGIAVVLEEGVEAIHERLSVLKQALRDGLAAIDGVHVLSPSSPAGMPIVTITTDGSSASTLASRLDREHGVLTRAGLHCAPEVHRMLGTERTGALRFSLGWSSTMNDVERALTAVSTVLHATAPRPVRSGV
ncbi:MAG TPA: aminotransferase class V-fold PLP-dependent enzyme [Longimicrobiales bacterium]|nr:aminotransferase class V-fold PLP-dependent enzyme [Longimicrobiales bacterium]